MNEESKEFTLALPALDGGPSVRTVTLSRAAVAFLGNRLGCSYPAQVEGAFGALGLGSLTAPYLKAYEAWMDVFLTIGDRRADAVRTDSEALFRVSGNESELAQLRFAYDRMLQAWSPLRDFCGQCRSALGVHEHAAGDEFPFEQNLAASSRFTADARSPS